MLEGGGWLLRALRFNYGFMAWHTEDLFGTTDGRPCEGRDGCDTGRVHLMPRQTAMSLLGILTPELQMM